MEPRCRPGAWRLRSTYDTIRERRCSRHGVDATTGPSITSFLDARFPPRVIPPEAAAKAPPRASSN